MKIANLLFILLLMITLSNANVGRLFAGIGKAVIKAAIKSSGKVTAKAAGTATKATGKVTAKASGSASKSTRKSGRIWTKKGAELKNEMRRFNRENAKPTKQKHENHYRQRFKAAAEVLRTAKNVVRKPYFKNKTKRDKLVKNHATHQDVKGRGKGKGK